MAEDAMSYELTPHSVEKTPVTRTGRSLEDQLQWETEKCVFEERKARFFQMERDFLLEEMKMKSDSPKRHPSPNLPPLIHRLGPTVEDVTD